MTHERPAPATHIGPQRGPASLPQVLAQSKQASREVEAPAAAERDLFENERRLWHVNTGMACKCCGQCEGSSCKCPAVPSSELEGLRAEVERLRLALSEQQQEIEQILGKALGYPKFSDDQKNFPGATGDDVCVGAHVAESLASEIATVLAAARETITRLTKEIEEAKAQINRYRMADEAFMRDALVAIAGAVCTPEKGYMVDGGPSQLLADIKTLRKQRDDFKLCYDIRNKHELSPQSGCECPVCNVHRRLTAATSRIAELSQALRESIEIFERVPVDLAGSDDVRRQIRANQVVLKAEGLRPKEERQ